MSQENSNQLESDKRNQLDQDKPNQPDQDKPSQFDQDKPNQNSNQPNQEKPMQPSKPPEDLSNTSSAPARLRSAHSAEGVSSNDAVKDLLLADHEHFSSMFANSEQAGETRVNWFIGIVTATSGGLIALFVKQRETGNTPLEPSLLFAIAFGALAALLVFGFLTLRRMMLRNASSDRQKRALDQIRQMFQDYFDPQHLLIQYHPLGAPKLKREKTDQKPAHSDDEKTKSVKAESPSANKVTDTEDKINNSQKGETDPDNSEGKKLAKKSDFREFWDELNDTSKSKMLRRLGGLAHTVAAINSLLIAALCAVVFYVPLDVVELEGQSMVLEWFGLLLPVIIVAFVLQWLWISFTEFKELKQVRDGDCTHAGGVVFRQSGDTTEYLIIRPSDPSKNEWVLPKGKIETYESHQEAALREVREEAKVTARIVGLVGESTFEFEGNLVRSKFYLMEFVRTDVDNKKDRVTNWKDFNEARRLLTHPESKAILDLAAGLG